MSRAFSPKEISSLKNPKVKQITALVRRPEREKTKTFVAEGPTCVTEALKRSHIEQNDGSELTIQSFYFTQEAIDRFPDIFKLSDELGQKAIERFVVTEQVMVSISDTVNSQGVLVICRFLDSDSISEVKKSIPQQDKTLSYNSEQKLSEDEQTLVLCQISDPANAGTMIRVADAAGVRQVIFTSHSVDVYNPKVVRGTAGSIFHLPIVVNDDYEEVIKNLKDANYEVVATDGYALDSITDYLESTKAHKIAWLIGNEAHGLSNDEKDMVDKKVYIPMQNRYYGQAESLNAATATAICLYHQALQKM